MTFTVIACCARSGKMGFCQATSTPAVGWRCAEVIPGKGVLTVQAHSDYRQLQRARNLLDCGTEPSQILEKLAATDKYYEFRQIAVLDFKGRVATFTGQRARPWAGEIVGPGFVVTGNVLIGRIVVESMAAAFTSSADEELEERLLIAVEAGRDAGGQSEGQTSCALAVWAQEEFPIVNLRIDVDLEPVGAMRRIFDWFKPLIPYYVQRTIDPSSVVPKKEWLEQRGLVVNPFIR